LIIDYFLLRGSAHVLATGSNSPSDFLTRLLVPDYTSLEGSLTTATLRLHSQNFSCVSDKERCCL